MLIDELHRKLGAAVHLTTPVTAITRVADGWQVTTEGPGGRRETLFAAVLFTGTAHKLAETRITAPGAPSLAPLADITYPPVASVVLGFRRADVAHPLDGFGILIPAGGGFKILGTLVSSSLFPNRAPAGHVAILHIHDRACFVLNASVIKEKPDMFSIVTSFQTGKSNRP